jgi:predicted transcriptional regulator
MSNTTTNDTPPLHAAPGAEPLTQLTGAPAAIYAHLVALTSDEGATAAELASAAGLGRSTTSKALVTLEEHGMAVRTPGGHDGPRRTPDHWRATPTPETTSSDDPRKPEPTPSHPESAADNQEPDISHADGGSTLADASALDSDETNTSDQASVSAASAADAPQQDGKQPGEEAGNEADAHHDGGNDGPEPEDTHAPETSPEQPTTAPAEAAIQTGEKKRLAPGALRQMVIGHLRVHPGEAFTATKISRVIEKSSGAIANALDKLVGQGIAEQVSERPRTYRMAMPDGNA